MIITEGTRQTLASSLNTALANGQCLILSTPYPIADRSAAIPAGEVLSRFTLGATPFSISGGVLTLQGAPFTDVSADNTGTARSLVLLENGDTGASVAGSNNRLYFSVGESGDTVDLSGVGGSASTPVEGQIANKSVVAGQEVRLNSLSITVAIGDATS